MHDQQIDITHGLLSFLAPLHPFFIFVILQQQNTTTNYPQHIQLFH